MFGLNYLKVPPTTYVMQHKKGVLTRQGAGLSFYYFAPWSTIVLIPAGSIGVPFVFEETTLDFQEVTIQGELTYQITDPEKTGSLLDFSVDGRQRFQSDDPTQLNERLVQATQIQARAFTQAHPLQDVLTQSERLVSQVAEGLKQSSVVTTLGVDILDCAIGSIDPSPDMAKALQADAREKLLQKADEAVSERRNAAVEMERKIRENELETEIAIEQKRRQVEEKKMEAAIAVEEQRTELVAQRVENERQEARARGDALQAVLAPLKDVDWRTLVASQGMRGEDMIAMAFRDLADNAGKIGQLNISPDLLETLLGRGTSKTGENPKQQNG